MRTLSKAGLDFIKGFESFVPYLYDDLRPVRTKYGYLEYTGGPVKGTLSLGYGHTADARSKVSMAIGTRLTEPEACKVLDEDLGEIKEAVNSLVKVPITQGQFDALVSFGFNCGIGNLKKLIIPLNNGDYDGTRAKFSQYTRSKGQVLTGLVRRRTGEQKLWDMPDGKVPEVKVVPKTTIIIPEEPVETPKSVEKSPDPASIVEKVAAAGAPVVTALSAFSDWKVAAVLGVTLLVGGTIYLWLRNK